MGLRTEKRRRLEKKTDYKLRLGLLKSGLKRVVIRKTNKYFIVQVVESDESKDKVLFGITSKDLIKAGFDEKKSGSLKSIPAGYLTGLLLSKKVKDKLKDEKLIIDLGMARTLPGSRVYSVVKGLIDGGLNIDANEKVFPKKERLEGIHLKSDVKDLINKVREKL